ncbi:MAG: CopG family transcriptional regulator [Cryomorphaceae bacterium]|nr:CopG family transcriptional regulator [Cryomorphaceae bacterium]
MTTFTSSLPDDVLKMLADKAKSLSVPKNKIIERALRIYLDQLNRAEYVQSYKQMTGDVDLLKVAEEGMEEYIKQLDHEER